MGTVVGVLVVGARVVGVFVGVRVGTSVGCAVGEADGAKVGVRVGLADGALLGRWVGAAVARTSHTVSAATATAGERASNVGTESTGTQKRGCIVAAQAGATSTPIVFTPVALICWNDIPVAAMFVGLLSAITIISFGTPARPDRSIFLAASTPAFRSLLVKPALSPRRSSIGAAPSVTLHPISGCTALATVAYVTRPTLMFAPYGPMFIESIVFLTKAVCCAYWALVTLEVAWMTKTMSAMAHVDSLVIRAADSDGEPVGADVGNCVALTEGAPVGASVGLREGDAVGVAVGTTVGAKEGEADGDDEGLFVGVTVGAAVG